MKENLRDLNRLLSVAVSHVCASVMNFSKKVQQQLDRFLPACKYGDMLQQRHQIP